MATHSSIIAWRIPWTEEPGGLQFTRWKRVGPDWSNWYPRETHGSRHPASFSFLRVSLVIQHCVLNICCIPGSALDAGNGTGTREPDSGQNLLFLSRAQFGFGKVRKEASLGIRPWSDWVSLSMDALAAPCSTSSVTQSCLLKLFPAHAILLMGLLPSWLSLSLSLPEGFVPWCPSLHEDSFPSSVTQRSPFWCSPCFPLLQPLERTKAIQPIAQAFCFDGARVLSSCNLSSLHCLAQVYSFHTFFVSVNVPSPWIFSSTWVLSRVRLLLTPQTVTRQAPPSMEFSWQEY